MENGGRDVPLTPGRFHEPPKLAICSPERPRPSVLPGLQPAEEALKIQTSSGSQRDQLVTLCQLQTGSTFTSTATCPRRPAGSEATSIPTHHSLSRGSRSYHASSRRDAGGTFTGRNLRPLMQHWKTSTVLGSSGESWASGTRSFGRGVTRVALVLSAKVS